MSDMLRVTSLLLNNWHYINEKVISFHKNINFFTGHSGSGKSTVIDALQLLLYADTDGRGFFNKAAKDDSNRTLIEYLRGMNNVSESGEATYLRNQNFSSTIALELYNTETKEYQVIGVAFDVETATNEVDRMFFWHKGNRLANGYRYEKNTMTINQLKEYLKRTFHAEDWWFSRTNEKFRQRLYDTYLGGLDERKFPMLFKKAISFRMDTKLEDFVKEFICVEKDIHIEDMQESVIQYVRLKRKLEDTKAEIEHLLDIKDKYEVYAQSERTLAQYEYNQKKLHIDWLSERIATNQHKQQAYTTDIDQLTKTVQDFSARQKIIQQKQVEIKTAIGNSGYDHLLSEQASKKELLGRMERSKEQLTDTIDKLFQLILCEDLKEFGIILDTDIRDYLQAIIEYPEDLTPVMKAKEELFKLKEQLGVIQEKLQKEYSIRNDQLDELKKEYRTLKEGKKAYPEDLCEAREYIEDGLRTMTGEPVLVSILADLIEIKNDSWQNAVEGYMSNQKLALIVPPEYCKEAMELYHSLDPVKYHKVTLIDTKKVLENQKEPKKGSLAEEILTKLPYVKAYTDYLLGGVIKCGSMEELRETKCGITRDCVLYQGYRIMHIAPKHYTKFAYIGSGSVTRRMEMLEESMAMASKDLYPYGEQLKKIEKMLTIDFLTKEPKEYEELIKDARRCQSLKEELSKIEVQLEELKKRDVEKWRKEENELEAESLICQQNLNKAASSKETRELELTRLQQEYYALNEELNKAKEEFVFSLEMDTKYKEYKKGKETYRLQRVAEELSGLIKVENARKEKAFEILIAGREQYKAAYSYRGFSVTARDNASYEELLQKLSSEKLGEYTKLAAEQAKKAILHFKTDFVYKVRDAIKEALQQKEDLNQILKQTDFGKEKYRFVIEKNKGEDGKFFAMFMDDNLDINPSQLSDHMENQMDLFTASHEDKYNDQINELIDIFMPPENSSPEQLEEARRNIEKYADYRTYLSFDMEQIIEGMPPMRLSKMLTKNSGGEGQNPLYVALLASFAEVYRVSFRGNLRRRLTPRLVVLDEAFSKMDGEKVASCLELIRKLGFQAIISATNDKIQNYVESVDKTFVFANPNKSYISIQEFERQDFGELLAINRI